MCACAFWLCMAALLSLPQKERERQREGVGAGSPEERRGCDLCDGTHWTGSLRDNPLRSSEHSNYFRILSVSGLLLLSNYTFSLDFRNSSAHVVCVAGKVSHCRNRHLLFGGGAPNGPRQARDRCAIEICGKWRHGKLTQG